VESTELKRTHISRTTGIVDLQVQDIWNKRELLYFLTLRDLKVRYAQTVLGASWAILQPLLTALIFAVVFGSFARLPSDGVPYLSFALTGLVPWLFFSSALTGASSSLLNNSNLITKIYFPRIMLPLSSLGSCLADFVLSLSLLVAIILFQGIDISWSAAWYLPILTIPLVVTSFGVGAGLAALNLRYRDVRHVVPFLIQLWMFATPIIYPLSMVPEKLRPYYLLNPMAEVVIGFRAVLLHGESISSTSLLRAIVVGAIFACVGLYYFRKTERDFADVI
jgi:lipopolysaccharide transport system permease protein